MNSFENFRTTVEIWNFPIPNAYWSGFGTVFEQNRKDPDKTRMIKESSQKYYFLWPHLCLTRLNEFRFFLTYFLRTSFKFSSMQWNDYSYPWTNEWWDLVWTVSMWLAPVRPGPGPVRFLCKSAADCTWSIALELRAISVGIIAEWSFHIMGSSAVF